MLEIKDLHVNYGAVHALNGVSMTVNDGEIVSPHRCQRRGQNHHAAHHHRAGKGRQRVHHL